ncbi:MAG: type II toxin-antitoxin system HicA family toxin [Actinomycetia bacterium]|nr:type II toxin-antitoxin system HicA family toxin [Actinomycetes bacterium]
MPVHKVREVILRLEADGWELTRGGKGSHRKYKKAGHGALVVPGKLSDDLKPGTYRSIARSAGWE